MSIFHKLPFISKFFNKSNIKARVYRSIDSDRRRARLFFYPIRALFRAVARTQHQEIQSIGLENIPPDGAVFLVGNHPNSFLDFFNLINVIRHPIATAAKDVITKTPVIGPILKNYALLIPVSRAQDRLDTGISEEERIKANKKMIEEAVAALVRGRLFNIYAEGRSTDSRALNKIKLGFIALAIQAEKQFNFNLNLRIVPYGYYYDRINKFQSSVCIIFARPFKIKNVIEMPEDFLTLAPKEQSSLEKKIMLAGKKKLKSEIEKIIISIEDPKLIPIIDDATALYVKSPVKYMGQLGNIREKYILSKTIAESFQKANRELKGREMLHKLKRLLSEFRRKLSVSRMNDVQIKQEYTLAFVVFQIKSLFQGILYIPPILYGFIANFIPRMAGRFMRFWVIQVKKREKVDGDEQAIIAALITVIITYPAFGYLIHFVINHFCLQYIISLLADLGAATTADFIKNFQQAISVSFAVVAVYMMARLWRFSLYYGKRLNNALLYLKDASLEPLRRKRLRHLRELRGEVIDTIDFIIGDYS